MKKYHKESFKEFLGRRHMKDEPTILDDDLPDAFEHWLCEQDIDHIIALAEIWNIEQSMVDMGI